MITYTLVDIETVDFRGGILEIGAIKIDEWLKEVERIEIRTKLIWPKNHVSGFCDSEVGFYTEAEAIEILKNFVKKDIVILWNATFEMRMFLPFKYGPRYLDLMKVTKDAYKNLPSYKLTEVADIFKIDIENSHRAIRDCEMMQGVLKQFKKSKLVLNI